VAERFDDAAVPKTIAVDLALITYYDELLKALELSLLKTAKPHDANTLYLLQTVPGIGKILSLGLRYEIHDICRFPSVQDVASYCRLVKCRKASGGKRLGTAGKKIGNAHLTWAFAEAATLFLRNNDPGQQLLARLEKKHDKGNALSILAHKLGRAVYYMLTRKTARVRCGAGSEEYPRGFLAQEACAYGQSRGVMPLSCAYFAADISIRGRTSA
jgi:transposase